MAAAFFARLETMPTEPAALGSLAFFARAFSMSNDGMVMTLATLALTLLLELLSFDGVRQICGKKGGTKLYAQGVLCNIINNGVLGPPLYELVASRWLSSPFTAVGRVAMVGAILVGHSVGYYSAHRWMHTRRMYWAHRFHHRFNTHVVPVTANAVSPRRVSNRLPFCRGLPLPFHLAFHGLPRPSAGAPFQVSLAEYALAYMLPFIVGAKLLLPDRLSMFVAVGIVSLNNLLIHTPALADASARLVSATDCH